MNINYNSFLARLFRKFYGENVDMPSTLLYYILALLTVCIFFIPFYVIGLPSIIFNHFYHKQKISLMKHYWFMFIVYSCISIFIVMCLPFINLFYHISGNTDFKPLWIMDSVFFIGLLGQVIKKYNKINWIK